MPGWRCVARAQTAATPEAVWAVLLDGRRWERWYPGVEWMVVEGDLVPGNFLTIKPKAWLQTAFRIVEVARANRLSFVTRVGPLATVRCQYDLLPTATGCELAIAFDVSGPLTRTVKAVAGRRIEEAIPRAASGLGQCALENMHSGQP